LREHDAALLRERCLRIGDRLGFGLLIGFRFLPGSVATQQDEA